MKLTKRNGQAVLCIETRAMEIDIVHDIRVTVNLTSQSNHTIPTQLYASFIIYLLYSLYFCYFPCAPFFNFKKNHCEKRNIFCLHFRVTVIKVMAASDYEHYAPPETPLPQVQLELPTSKTFKVVVDRLRNISK
jgi:hypothetical protein